MTIPKIITAEYSLSAHRVVQCPPGELPEVAFLGRSNVGKSTLINTLLGRRKLVRTSARPGCTRALNFFLINQSLEFRGSAGIRLCRGVPGPQGELGAPGPGLPGAPGAVGRGGLSPGWRAGFRPPRSCSSGSFSWSRGSG